MAKSKDNLTKLAQWTQKIDFTTSRDPLGLANRVSQRLIQQLLFGITAIGNRARYYSYSLWAILDVMKRERPTTSKEMKEGIYWRDSAFMAACLIHHKDQDYDIDGVIGKDKGSKYLAETKGDVDLSKIEHIESNLEGGFGLNYKGSLFNLDFFKEAYYDDSQKELVYEVSDQPAIKKMLECFERNIKETVFYKQYACKRKSVPRHVLEEFGQKICVCLLPQDNAPERDILRDILYERTEGYLSQKSFRPSSLRMLLYCAQKLSKLKVPFTEKQFRTMIYYGEYADTNNKYKPIHFNKEVDEIVNRWRIFFMHHYLSIALEGIFIVLLNILSESIDTGLTLNQIFERLKTDGLIDAVKDITGISEINFDKTSIGEILRESLGDGLTRSCSPWTILNAENMKSEENLIADVNKLIKSSHIKAISKYVVILMILMEKCSRLEKEDKYWGWALSVSKGDYAKSISAPIIYLYLKQHQKNWKDITLKDYIEIIIRRFVIEQHELMVPEKKGGVSWLTYDDGHLSFQNSFDGPSPGSSRFDSARQIICDLGLMKLDDNDVPQLLPYSDVILSEIMEENK